MLSVWVCWVSSLITKTWIELSRAKNLGDFYMVRFQDPAVAAELDADVEGALRRIIYAYDGATPDNVR